MQRLTVYLEYVGAIGVLAGVYFISAKFGLTVAFIHSSATLIWPPTGISLAVLILFGYRYWPGFFLGAFFANVTTEGTALTSLGIAAGNTMEALAGAYLVNTFASGVRAFERLYDATLFISCAALIAPAVSASVGVASLYAGGFVDYEALGAVWFTWWLGDVASALVVAPFLILWMRHYRLEWGGSRSIELIAFALALFVSAGIMFAGIASPSGLRYPVTFLVLPLFVWVAVRFSPRETAAAVLGLAVIAIVGTLQGYGPFAEQPTMNESLVFLQVFISVIAVTSLVLAVLVLERREAEGALLKADVAKDDFLATLSHEVRNPLASIFSYVQLLQRSDTRPFERKKALDIIGSELRDVIRLFEDLLDISRVRRGRMQLYKKPTDLGALLRATAKSVEPLMKERRHSFGVQVSGEPLRINADEGRVKQILINMLTNAAKYSDSGGAVSLRARRAGAVVEIAVIDKGFGIAPERLPDIFAMRGSSDQSRDTHAGLGIGLALTKRLVEMHHGEIRVESEGVGKGSTFTVSLPLLPPETAPAAASTQAPLPLLSERTHVRASPRARRVLLVDDNERAAEALAQLMRKCAHEAHIARTGESALSMLREVRPDVVILDIALPDIDGYTLIKRMKSSDAAEGSKLLCIALSGYGRQEDMRRSLEAGFDYHVVKPVDIDVLQNILQS